MTQELSRWFMTTISASILVYLVFLFVSLEPNIFLWGSPTRALYVTITAALTLIIIILTDNSYR